MKTLSQPYSTLPDISDPSLVGAYLNRSVRGNAKDASANGFDGIPVDMTYDEEGGGTFNGSSSNIGLGTDTVVSDLSGASAVTVEMWINPETFATNDRMITYTIESNSKAAFILDSQGATTLRLIGRSQPADGSMLLSISIDNPVGKWVYLVGILDFLNNKIIIHVDSVKSEVGIAFGSDTLDIGTAGNKASIGSNENGSGQYYDGSIRGFNIHAEGKSDSWVSKRFAKGVPDPSLGLFVDDGTKDKSRFRNAITNVNGVIVGNEMEFDGTNYLECGDIESGGNITAGIWCKRDSIGANKIVFSKNYTAWELQFTSDNFPTAFINSTGVNSPTAMIANRDYLIGLTYDKDAGADNIILYVDGVPVNTGTETGIIVENASEVTLGARAGGVAPFVGKSDKAFVYNETKSADWWKQYYLKTRGRR